MKKLLIIFIVLSLYSYCFAGGFLNGLEDKNIMIIENQSFWVTLENWGKVQFLSCEDEDNKLIFYIANEKGYIIYKFPDFLGNDWYLYELKAVSFKDVNKDGLKDIVIIADYMTGIGNEGAIPFPVCGIYFQKGEKFIDLPELNEEINGVGQNTDISTVMKFTNSKLKQIDEMLKKY
jgi:hypothetical protein